MIQKNIKPQYKAQFEINKDIASEWRQSPNHVCTWSLDV